jgi:hypothetical protein
MILLDQIISESEIVAFKKYFQNNFDKKYVNWSSDDEQIIDHRLTISESSPEFEIIRRIVANNFTKDPVKIWSAYQRQGKPHNIHIDDYGSELKDKLTQHFRYTYILAMDTVPEFKAVIWKEKCWDNEELHTFVQQWGKLKKFKKKISNISESEDLEHTFDQNQESYMADYLTLDGIYTYKIGTACLFDATQLHCTSNWIKYNKFPYRELLQIHVLTDTAIDC